MIGDLNKAKHDLLKAHEYGQSIGKPDKAVNDALKEVQAKLDKNKKREKEMSQRMFSFGSGATKATDEKVDAAEEPADENGEQVQQKEEVGFVAVVTGLVIDIVFGLYSLLYHKAQEVAMSLF